MTDFVREYAGALYSLASEEHLAEEMDGQLKSLNTLFCEYPDFLRLLDTRSIPIDERRQVIDDALSDRCHTYVISFLKILTERGAAKRFPECVRFFHNLWDEDFGVQEAVVITAAPLEKAQREALINKLESIGKRRVILREQIDPGVIGGLCVEMNGHRMDNTIRTQLSALRGELANR